MKKEFKRANALVLKILEENPKTRNSDNLLYLIFLETVHPGITKQSIATILLNLESLGLPCFETIRRARQKIQAEREDLKADEAVQDFRTEREIAFREFFGGIKNE